MFGVLREQGMSQVQMDHFCCICLHVLFYCFDNFSVYLSPLAILYSSEWPDFGVTGACSFS